MQTTLKRVMTEPAENVEALPVYGVIPVVLPHAEGDAHPLE